VFEIPNTDALTTGLRYNGRGYPDAVTFLLSYLLDGAAVRFTDFADHNGLVDSYSTTEGEPPENVVHFGGPKPLLTAFLLQKQVTSLTWLDESERTV
jgi:hypothetical protein